MLQWIVERAREPSTYAGITMLVGVVLKRYAVGPELAGAITDALLAVAGAAAVALREARPKIDAQPQSKVARIDAAAP